MNPYFTVKQRGIVKKTQECNKYVSYKGLPKLCMSLYCLDLKYVEGLTLISLLCLKPLTTYGKSQGNAISSPEFVKNVNRFMSKA